jgi:PAS domain S-box-containing protein
MNPFPYWMKAVFAFTTIVLIGGGTWFYHVQTRFLENEAFSDLEAVAQLKLNEISQWRTNRLADAAQLTESPFLVQAMARWLKAPTPESTQEVLTRIRSISQHGRYRDVLVVDPAGKVRLSLSGRASLLHETVGQEVSAALRDRKPLLTDLHMTPGQRDPHLDIVAPLVSMNGGDSRPIGAIVLQCDATQFLYPLIQSWPVASPSAETLLVRRDGDDVLFLNELRHQKNTALTLRIPLSRKDVPSVMAISGRQGIVRGRDYRGIEVLSVLKAVPDSPWFMVAKIDTAEALSAKRRESLLIVALLLGLIGAAASAAGVIWQRAEKVRYRSLLDAETARQRSEEKYRATLMSVGDGVIATDGAGLVELLNPVAEALTGWTSNEAYCKPLAEIFNIINEETRSPAENPVEKALKENRIVSLANHTCLISRDGAEIPIEDSAAPIRDAEGKPIGAIMVFHDVTERRRTETALRKAHDELEQRVHARTVDLARQAELLNLTHDAIIVRDMEDRITFWNKGAENIYGWTAEHACGNNIQHLLKTAFPRDRQTTKAELLSTGRWDGEIVRTRADGSQITVSSRRALRRDPRGEPTGILEINSDITEQKRVEQQVRQKQKLETVGTLASGIAHDFNNILAAVIGFSEMAWEKTPEGPVRHRIERVIEAGKRGRSLVRRVLTFSRKAEHQRQPMRPAETVRETVNLMESVVPSIIDIRADVRDETGLVLADPIQIQQVLMNFCTNAAYAMKQSGGTITVSLDDFSFATQGDAPDPALLPGHYLRVSVTDAGEGMTPEVMERIFDPFFTTKPEGEGTGLGLSVADGIVSGHGGAITVSSVPGHGSTFSLYLPRYSKASSSETDDGDDTEVRGGKERILFIDDEEALAELGADMLTDLGYAVTPVTDGRQALALFRLDPGEFDLVITDHTIPGLTGVQIATEMLTLRPDIPIILCTGFSASIPLDRTTEAGIRLVLRKPLTRQELARAIRTVLDGRT